MSRTVRDRRSSGAGLRVLTLAAALLVAACGDAPAPGSGAADSSSTSGGSVTSSPEPTASPSASPGGTGGSAGAGTELTIVIDNGSGTTTTWRLTCDPAGGDHPTAAAACKALEAHGERALPPVPPDRSCTALYGGPEKATVTGTWRGAPVDATFRKTNGCEIGRWKAMAGLLPGANA
jgi:hypothetical protein